MADRLVPGSRDRGQRRWGLLLLVVLGLALPTVAVGQGTITALEQGRLTASVGSRAGVKVGMQGGIIKPFRLQDTITNHLIGRFEVIEVEPDRCFIRVTRLESGWALEVGLLVRFDKQLRGLERPVIGRVRPTPTPATRKITLADAASTSTPVPPTDIRLTEAREQARRYVDRGDWAGAVEWLRRLAAADTSEPILTDAITAMRRDAKEAFASNDYAAAIAACDVLLAVQDDAEASSLRQRAQAAMVEAQVGPQVAAALALVDELTKVEAQPPGQPLPPAALTELLERRARVLRDLVTAAAKADTAARVRLGEVLRALATNGKVPIAGGTFLMGCTEGDTRCQDDEKPTNSRKVAPFLLDPTEVTVAQFRAFVSATGHSAPSSAGFEQDGRHPVVNVSWDDADAYCRWGGGRLPTEAEWELAARAGSTDWPYPWGKSIDHSQANYEGVQGRDKWARTSPVAAFPPSRWGLFDMTGNAWEWCGDAYTPDYYAGSGSGEGAATYARLRVLRGGSWLGGEGYQRVSSRSWYPRTRHMFNISFRCARDVGGASAGGGGP